MAQLIGYKLLEELRDGDIVGISHHTSKVKTATFKEWNQENDSVTLKINEKEQTFNLNSKCDWINAVNIFAKELEHMGFNEFNSLNDKIKEKAYGKTSGAWEKIENGVRYTLVHPIYDETDPKKYPASTWILSREAINGDKSEKQILSKNLWAIHELQHILEDNSSNKETLY